MTIPCSRLAALLVAGALTACFGSGPSPSMPTGAEILFAAPSMGGTSCGMVELYVGDMTFANGSGFAAVVPYQIQGNCNNGGSNSPEGPESIYAFPLDGGDPAGMMVASLGSANVDGTPAPILTIATLGSGSVPGPVWLAAPPGGLTIGSPGSSAGIPLQNNGGGNVLAFVGAGATLYAAFGNANSMGAAADPDAPAYPCCGNGLLTGEAGSAGPVTISGGNATWSGGQGFQMQLGALTPRMVADGAGNVYYVSSTPAIAQLGATTPIASIDPSLASQQPTGLVFTGSGAGQLVYSFSPAIELSNGATPSGCTIASVDLASKTTTPVLSTSRFSCMGLASDGADVYFAIVEVDCGNCGNGAIAGIGIGRVSLTDPSMFESRATGITTLGAGPRRVYLQDGAIIAVDPFTVAKIDPTVLDGQHDFAL